MASPALPKMMLGFVVRRCTVALGHRPTAAELAAWANSQSEEGKPRCLFGRPITEKEAAVILRHPARAVSARSAAAHEQAAEGAEAANAVSLAAAAARHRSGPRGRARAPGRQRQR